MSAKKRHIEDSDDDDEDFSNAAAKRKKYASASITASDSASFSGGTSIAMTERQQMTMVLEESRRSALTDDSSSDDDDNMVAAKLAPAKKGGSARSQILNDSDSGSEDEDSNHEDDAPGMVTDSREARRWWEGTAAFDFERKKTEKNEEDGMLVEGDSDRYVGKIVKREFGRGIISYGKVVGWFPPEEEGDDILYHVLHGDGDEEDLDRNECRIAVRWAEEDSENSDEEDEEVGRMGIEAGGSRAAAASLSIGDVGSDSSKARAHAAASQAQRERMTALAAVLKKMPKYSSKAKDATESALRGVHFIFSLSRNEGSMTRFGSDLAQTLYDIGAVAPDPIRRDALQRVEHVSQAWKNRFKTLASLTIAKDAKKATPEEVTDAIMGLYSLERVGVEHPLKQETASIVKRNKFKKSDFLGFDVERDRVLLSGSYYDDRFTTFTSALNTAFFVSKVGIDLGFTLPEVLAHVRYLRPYQLAGHRSLGDGNEGWIDQITMIFNVVHVCSNFGELRLRPAVLPHEFKFLRKAENMTKALLLKDVHVVGELCHCLRIFGMDPYTCSPLREGLSFLLAEQNVRDGSWPTRGGDADEYTRYHAAMCATMALYEPVFRGFGPGSADLKSLCEKWIRKDKREGKATGIEDEFTNNVDDAKATKGLSNSFGIDGLAVPIGSLASVEEAYTGQREHGYVLKLAGERNRRGGFGITSAHGTPDEMKMAKDASKVVYKEPKNLEEHSEARLIGLLQWKITMEHATLDDFRNHVGGIFGDGTRANRNIEAKSKGYSSGGQSRVSKARIRASQLRASAEQIPSDVGAFEDLLLRHWEASSCGLGSADLKPSISDHRIHLHQLFRRVAVLGGFSGLNSSDTEWLKIIGNLRLPTSVTPKAIRELYKRHLQTFEIFFIETCVKLQQKHRQMTKASQLPLSSSLPGTKSDVQDAKKSKARKVVAPSDDEDEEAEWNENDGSDVDELI